MDNKVDKAFEKWKKKMGYGDFSGIVYETQREAFSAGFKTGQEHNEQVVEGFKGRIDYWSNRDIENRAQIKQLTDENTKLIEEMAGEGI